MLFWGKSSEFVNGSWSQHQEIGEMRPIDNGRTSDRLLDWINNHLNRYIYEFFLIIRLNIIRFTI